MRILSVSTLDQAGGAEKIARDLSHGYRAHGYESWLAVGWKRDPDSGALAIPMDHGYQAKNPLAIPRRSDSEIAADLERGREVFDFPGTWDLLDLPPTPPDILHCHNLHRWYFDLRALPWLGRTLPTVLTLHDAWLLSGNCAHSLDCERWQTGCGACPDLSLYPGQKRDDTAGNWLRKRAIFQQSRLYVATPCRWLMDKVENGILAEGMIEGRVIPQGVDLSVYRPGDRVQARRAVGLPDDAVVLLFAANGIRANPWKDYAGLRLTLQKLSVRLPGRRLLLIGLGESGPPEAIGEAQVIFLPFQSDPQMVATLYRAADVYVHMARAETYPNVVMEALACGLPVMASAVGGIPEQIVSAFDWSGGSASQDACGGLAAAGDADAMAERLALLLQTPELWQRLSENAVRRSVAHFDFRRVVRDYLDWFTELRERFPADIRPPTPRRAHDTAASPLSTPASVPAPASQWLSTLATALAAGHPVSRTFGLDRGSPVDRRYIEHFLTTHAGDIRGRVLEIGDATYTRRYGGNRVGHSDVLHAEPGNPAATIIGSLTDPATVPKCAFDCIILTQTLHCILDMRTALQTARDALAPGGALLFTVPNITPISRYDMDRWGDFWRFTSKAVMETVRSMFPEDELEVTRYGNAAAATAFLNGIAAEELPDDLLWASDPDYEVTIAARLRRRSSARQVRRVGTGVPPVILMYHRVADLALDPQLLSTTPGNFDQQIAALSSLGTPMPLAEFTSRLAAGKPVDSALVVTFDDGYADNLLAAKPVLQAHGVPATMFVTAGMVDGDREFWWDELERLLLVTENLPPTITLRTGKGDQVFSLGDSAHYGADARHQHADWSVEQTNFPTLRHMLYRYLQQAVHNLGEDQRRQSVLDAVAAWAGLNRIGRTSYRPLRAEEVVALASGVTTVGAHTMTHPMLALLSEDAQRQEILGSRCFLQELTGSTIDFFAYPYGSAPSFSPQTIAIVKEALFAAAFSTLQAPVRAGDDLFTLPRMTVRNWTAEELERRLTDFRHPRSGAD
ncbi:polysaccharide deacetylase family protein [Azospirillum sp. YIM B02556]|uniref:Chitooligosaccharide deacetylase n=1 Tax=Azospirillum endophyticum TaxID=2800326 RepID=A0ABS1FBA8_9PROT|nr:polysaccharide deacetylase family protein [Azospirillum endophyticum]MBK1840713.1 polysaccharide deacetylase family protein [Azospirillum endophyticum]